MSKICVLFLHGLSLPSHVDAINKGVEKQILQHFHKSDLFHVNFGIVNYARLLEKQQTELWNRQGYSWLDIVTPFRLIPLRFLNLGLSFWGDPAVQRLIYDEIVSKINDMASEIYEFETTEQVTFVIAGFSMGATILVEFLSSLLKYQERHNTTRQTQDKLCFNFTEHGWRLIKRLSLLLTVGCALNWHFPLRPFTRTSNPTPWTNVHYVSDVLASGIREQDVDFEHVRDLEVSILFQCQEDTGLSKSAPNGTLSALWHYLRRTVLILGRSTPLSHFLYFHDLEVTRAIASSIVNASQRQVAADFGPSPKPTQVFELPTDIVTTEHVCNYGHKETCTKNFVFVYTHGMSSLESVDQEVDDVREALKIMCAKNPKVHVSLYCIRYYHLMQKDVEVRTKGRFGEPAKVNWARYQQVRNFILKRFPVAMAYWTERTVKRAINEGFKEELRKLSVAYQHEDCSMVLVGNTIGSIVLSSILAELQQEHRLASLHSLPSALAGSPSKTHLHAFISLACPLPWFGSRDDQTLPIFDKSSSLGWVNFHYKNDFCSVSLTKSGRNYETSLTAEVELASFKRQGDFETILAKVLRFLRLSEFLGSWNGCYLKDEAVWNRIFELF